MKRCSNCNITVQDNVNFCPECGYNYFIYDNNNQYNYQSQYNYVPQYGYQQSSNVSTTPPFLWGLIGFLVPIAGLILYLVWKNSNPEQAKAAGKGALIYVGLVFAVAFLFAMAIQYA